MSEAPENDAAAQLRAAREQLKAFREERDAKLKPAQDELETRRTLQRLADEQTIAKYEDELGAENVRHVFFEMPNNKAGAVAIVTRPKYSHYIAFANKGKDDYHSQQAYVSECLVYPKMDELEKWLKLEPFKLTSLAGSINILAGVTVSDNLAK